MPRVTTAKAEIEFSAGVWSDVSADVDWSSGWSYQLGRTVPRGAAQTTMLSVTLYNPKGKYTPGVQVLSDGTAATYWPNVTTRKRLRVSINGSVRWLGFIKGWYPQMDNGVLGKVVVQAADRGDALARVQLRHPYLLEHFSQAANAGGTSLLYLLNEPATPLPNLQKVFCHEYNRVGPPLMWFTSFRNESSAGANDSPLPAADGLTGLNLSAFVLFGMQPAAVMSGDFVASMWVTLPVLSAGDVLAGTEAFHQSFSNTANTPSMELDISYPSTPLTGNITVGVRFFIATFANISGSGPADDGQPHHYAIIATTSAGTQTIKLYCDGVQCGSASSGATGQLDGQGGIISSATPPTASGEGPLGFGPASYYWGGTYSPAMIQALYTAGTGFAGDTTSARMARILAYAGLSPSDYSLDTGLATMGPQPLNGNDVVTASQAIAATEGAGSVVYVGAGSVIFKSRSARAPGAPALTIDASRDLARDVWQPSHDDAAQTNQIVVTRSDDAGTITTQAIDQSAGGPIINDDITTYADTDADALGLAQSFLSQNFTPGFRLPQVSVDLVTAENNLYAAALSVVIGSRLRVSNIPAGMAPTTQLDSIIEGWREEYSLSGGIESYRFTFDTSPADSPPWMVWNDASYGRWQASGNTLNAGITAAATTLVIATSAGNPTFTTDPTMYPLTIQIGAEHIRLNSAPGGSASPQTFTGATRGVDGTTAGAQSGGSAVDLAPASTWTL